MAVVRSPAGWSVVAPDGPDHVGDLVEGLTLADLVAEDLGGMPEPDRTARRSARGAPGAPGGDGDPRDARIAALERTVAQLEHALAARVATERAIGMLVERHAVEPREAFEALRRDARTQGRAVAELAREVLDGSRDAAAAPPVRPTETAGAAAEPPPSGVLPPAPRPPSFPQGSRPCARPGLPVIADGRS